MAEITFRFTYTDGTKEDIADILSFEWHREADAPCDAVQLRLFSASSLREIDKIEMLYGSKKVFSGYCDTQRETPLADGYEVYVYARSTACVLIDNEAVPFTYQSPTARALYSIHIRDYGFSYRLPEYRTDFPYTVTKGTSCYGALNGLVSGITGKNLAVSPDNALYLPTGNDICIIPRKEVISERSLINRGNVLSRIDYKLSGETEYRHHLKSRFFEEAGIEKSIKLNLSSYSEAQRSYLLLNRLRRAALTYRQKEINLCGIALPELYGKVRFDDTENAPEDEILTAVSVYYDSKGYRTRLLLSKNIDLKEIHYVA